jgi:serine/threonine-protein kinase
VTRSGFVVEKRYRLDKRIAAGGVGQVWRATDLLIERPVAVKVLRPEYADHPDTLDRFRKEARNAGLLTHPHVAQVFDYGPGGADCPPYLVMEFVDGPSLADVLAADAIGPAVALDVIAQTAAGLSAAHRAGLVHRDVKPGNILIGPGGQVKVTDFGIAHAAGQAPVTGPGLVMGTAQYLAPERIAGGPATPASDLYALGIVLHECLTGLPPFEGTSADVMAAHLYLPLPPLPASVPAEVGALVDRLAAKDPARRISDAGELADLAARLRDAIAPGRLVPSAQAHRAGPGGVADPVPTLRYAQLGHARGGGLAELAAGAAPGFALGRIDPGAPGPGSPGTGAPGGQPPGYVSDEWVVPARMTSSTAAIMREDPAQRIRRRRAAALAVGAAVVTGTALAGLLASGAFHGAPTANPTPAASASATKPGAHPSTGAGPASTGPAGAATPAGRHGSNAAVPRATSPQATHASTKAAPSASPSGATSGSPSTSPSGAPSTRPTPLPTGSPCIAGICF